MVSHNQQKLLRKLKAKKHRWAQQLFVAEGRKVVQEMLDTKLSPQFLVCEAGSPWREKGALEIPKAEFQNLSSLETADEVLGVFPFPTLKKELGDFVLILDGVKDPGNLGTVVRTADWFGVSAIFCTPGTVDIFNPKTVQSTMGSIARVAVFYNENEEIFEKLNGKFSFACAEMSGTDFRKFQPQKPLALILGNESHGVSDFWKSRSKKITIPKNEKAGTESLNVAVAGGILIAHFS